MRPKTARNHIYETISSACSRRSTSSPEPPPSQGASTHLSDSPTVRNESASASLASRGQRVYRSISSALQHDVPALNWITHPNRIYLSLWILHCFSYLPQWWERKENLSTHQLSLQQAYISSL